MSATPKYDKVLLFKNIMNASDGKGDNESFSCGTHYLASSLKKANIEFIFSESRISMHKREFATNLGGLEKILRENRDINFILISVSEFYFEKAKQLIKFFRKKSRAFIGIGGIMPTLCPRHVYTHLPDIDFLIAGMGEEVLPRVIKILSGKNSTSSLAKDDIRRLSEINGFFFSHNGTIIANALERINKVSNYDNSTLDFSFFNRDDVKYGISLFTSWGCFNNCLFCTSPMKKRYLAKSPDNLKKIVADYHKRLKQLYKTGIPSDTLNLSFYDDDFIASPERAAEFFNYLRKTPFKIDFFQTGINSFFTRKDTGYSDVINRKLLDSLTPDIFNPVKDVNIYVGLENISNAELKRLAKGYGSLRAEKVIGILAKKKLKIAYHFIASNQYTSVEDILENLYKFSLFQNCYGKYFRILTPIIPYLISLYPSSSYRLSLKKDNGRFLEVRGVLSAPDNPAYDYPLVSHDIPVNKTVRKIIPFLHRLFSNENSYIRIFDEILFELLILQHECPSEKNAILKAVEKYKKYYDSIHSKTGGEINNIQLMITRRCHLRCKYCPVVKKEQDISKEVMYRAIDLLFESVQEELRLDFTGGEPLLRFDLVAGAVKYAKGLAKAKNKKVSFYLVTNLIELDDDIADFLKSEDFFLELSVDGDERSHNFNKLGKDPRLNAYRSTVSRLRKIFSRNIRNCAVMVATPATAGSLVANFRHLLNLGFRYIGINYALCSYWNRNEREVFLNQLDSIRRIYYPYIAKGVIQLSNLGYREEPAILNTELMIDVDGSMHLLTDWLFEGQMRGSAPSLGNVCDTPKFDIHCKSRFNILYRLLQFNPESRIRGIIFNNIEMGNFVKKRIESWKKR